MTRDSFSAEFRKYGGDSLIGHGVLRCPGRDAARWCGKGDGAGQVGRCRPGSPKGADIMDEDTAPARLPRPVLLAVDDDAHVLRALRRDLRRQYGDRYR